MNIFVGVHTNNDFLRAGVVLAGVVAWGILGTVVSSPARLGNGWPSPGRQAVRTVMVPWLAARPLMTCERSVDSPGWLPQLWPSRACGQTGMGWLSGRWSWWSGGAVDVFKGPGAVSPADRAMPSACPATATWVISEVDFRGLSPSARSTPHDIGSR